MRTQQGNAVNDRVTTNGQSTNRPRAMHVPAHFCPIGTDPFDTNASPRIATSFHQGPTFSAGLSLVASSVKQQKTPPG